MNLQSNFRIIFHYDGNPGNRIDKPSITCQIRTADKQVVSESKVKLYYKDIPNKVVGRAYAFKKAVNQLASKERRTALWNDFRNTMKQPT